MEQVHDIIETINDRIRDYLHRTGLVPTTVAISPGSYRRLLEIAVWHGRIGNLVIGCRPLRAIEAAFGTLRVIIDELLADTAVDVCAGKD